MNNSYALVETSQYKKHAQKWKSILKLGENVCVIFPYLSDRQSRVFQWSQQIDKKTFCPIDIDFSIYSFDDLEEFENRIISLLPKTLRAINLDLSIKNANKKIVLVITNGESLTNPHNYKTLHFLQKTLTSYAGKVLSFVAFESNIYEKNPYLFSYNKLFQNICFYPLYEDNDINLFVQYLCTKWKIKMPSPVRKSIISATGGSIWLTKEAVRNYRDLGLWSINSESFQDRLNLLSKSFSEKEIEILNSLPFIKPYEKTEEYKYLKNTGFITDKNKQRIPLLSKLFQSKTQPKNLLEINNEEITLKGVNISQILSPTEFSLLKLFLSKPNTPISRDKIAGTIWPNNTENRYSSWAIDQAVKRLRDRLVSLKLPPTTISSIRGVGYEYRS